MNDSSPKTPAAVAPASPRNDYTITSRTNPTGEAARELERHRVFRFVWRACTVALVIAVLLTMYAAVWEYSTRSYVKGFSDAIVPADATPVEKIQAILNWMSRGPARNDATPSTVGYDRDPVATLNYASLLQACGTATNAFINLADSAGLPSRRLLLLDSHRMTKHVVAEVLVNGRWVIVDPVFHVILRGPGGTLLTRRDLTNPVVFSAATRNIPNYDPAYNYKSTAHVHLARLGYLGRFLGLALDKVFPHWEDGSEVSLVLERESLAVLVLAVGLLISVGLLRVFLGWYGRVRLDIPVPSIRTRVLQGRPALFKRGQQV